MSRFAIVLSFLLLASLLPAPAVTWAEDAERPVVQAAPVAPEAAALRVNRAPRSAEEKALFELTETTRTRIEGLVRSMIGLPDGPALRGLQQKVEELKQQERVEFLRIKLGFARQRGDLATARECERMIELILNPPKPVLAPDSRALERARQEGGRP